MLLLEVLMIWDTYICSMLYSIGLRGWLKSATGGKTSVPQIFFNKRYVGGNRELQDIIAASDKQDWNALLREVIYSFGNVT